MEETKRKVLVSRKYLLVICYVRALFSAGDKAVLAKQPEKRDVKERNAVGEKISQKERIE